MRLSLRMFIDFIFHQMLEDPVQSARLRMVIDGYTEENGTQYDGLLSEYNVIEDSLCLNSSKMVNIPWNWMYMFVL